MKPPDCTEYRIMPKVTSADSRFTKFLSLVMLVAEAKISAVKAGLYIHLAHLHVSPHLPCLRMLLALLFLLKGIF
jgi:hypothetical protein